MTPTQTFLEKSRGLVDTIAAQESAINTAADWFAETILAGRMVHLFGSGHSRILTEEMWPRYGSFPGFNPIVELSLTFHNLVVGANGQPLGLAQNKERRELAVTKAGERIVESGGGVKAAADRVVQSAVG